MASGKKSRPERRIEPPTDFHARSNGEYCPTPPTKQALRAEAIWRDLVETKHKRTGMSRRQFSESACGVAAWLFALNQASCGSGASDEVGGGGAGGVGGAGGGAGGAGGGNADAGVIGMDAAGYDIDADMMEDPFKAREKLSGDEFIFDVQTHVALPEMTTWPNKQPPERALDFVKTIFAQSDTTVSCVSGVPNARDLKLGNVEARVQLQELIARFGGPRMIYHVNSNPQLNDELDHMAASAEMFEPGAWKTYPFSAQAGANLLDSAEAFIEQARKLNVKTICCHRGITSNNAGYNHRGSPLDVVRAAKKFPDVNFLIYHSGWERDIPEDHPYDPGAADQFGIDRTIKALEENGIGPDGNVYAELGTTWNNLKNNPAQAAHGLGKLLKHLGPDRIVWGTDCVFNNNPQPQIVAMRMFTIPENLQQAHGYPAMTDEIRRKIFGLNGARVYGVDPDAQRYVIKPDEIEELKMAYRHDRDSVDMPDRRLFQGPATRREYLAFLRREKHTA